MNILSPDNLIGGDQERGVFSETYLKENDGCDAGTIPVTRTVSLLLM